MQPWSKVGDPEMDSGTVEGDAALGHYILKIRQAPAVSQVPPHTEQDDWTIKNPALSPERTRFCLTA